MSARDVKTGLSELMVNFVTSSYKPELLMPLVEKISDIPEVVSAEILYNKFAHCDDVKFLLMLV